MIMLTLRDWEQGVRASVTEERLLVFRAGDGWAPLCSFLGTEIPTAEYPRLNNAQQFRLGYTRYTASAILYLRWGSIKNVECILF